MTLTCHGSLSNKMCNIRKGKCLQVVQGEAIWKVNLYNKPNEKCKSDYICTLPYSTKWKRAGRESDVGWYYQQWVRMLVKNKLGNKYQKLANLYPKGFAYKVLYYCYHWNIGNNQVTSSKVNRKVLYCILTSTQCFWETMQVRHKLFIY